ncbi:hypothetical protein RFI_36157 [Reticulomyxa filosa]|uniref:Uncharacterized protein n=1 Tax=Reticulomyxa filosa TaxID=46433 RepID=X6LJG5_RETFI|nr:hypothetical protein RFI_36157 [Reticulomyxa filosa]|eukprot:ETO01282.1 hypothetical protein RFI_36157 [Reticulomyxa filosa]
MQKNSQERDPLGSLYLELKKHLPGDLVEDRIVLTVLSFIGYSEDVLTSYAVQKDTPFFKATKESKQPNLKLHYKVMSSDPTPTYGSELCILVTLPAHTALPSPHQYRLQNVEFLCGCFPIDELKLWKGGKCEFLAGFQIYDKKHHPGLVWKLSKAATLEAFEKEKNNSLLWTEARSQDFREDQLVTFHNLNIALNPGTKYIFWVRRLEDEGVPLHAPLLDIYHEYTKSQMRIRFGFYILRIRFFFKHIFILFFLSTVHREKFFMHNFFLKKRAKGELLTREHSITPLKYAIIWIN